MPDGKSREIFEKICSVLDARNWHYKVFKEKLTISCGARGDDLPMDIFIIVNPKARVVSVYSPMPYRVSEDNRVDIALAVCAANFRLIQGVFEFDLVEGNISYKLTASYRDNEFSESYLDYLLRLSVNVIDDYNEKFLMIEKGLLPLDKFIEAEYSED